MKSIKYIGKLWGVCLAVTSLIGSAQAQETNNFILAANQSIALTRHEVKLLEDGRVVLRGATAGQTNAMSSVEAYYPARNQMIKLGNLSLPRALNAMALLPGGSLLFATGSPTGNGNDTTAQAELFNPTTGGSIFVGPVNIARNEATATELHDGTVLLTGGRNASFVDVLQAEVYNLTNSAFHLVGSMTAPRRSHTITVLADGRVLFVGGLPPSSVSAEVYDPATGQFTAVGNLIYSRFGHAAALLPDGRVLITGGELTVPPGGRLAQAEIFDPATQSFTAIGSMTIARRGHKSTLLADGTVLITGGLNSSSAFSATTEIFNPLDNSFATNVSMLMGRFNHQAVLMHDGRVLIPGGASGTNSRSAEIYDPTPELRLTNPAVLFDALEYLNNFTASLQADLGIATNTINGLTITNSNLQAELTYANEIITEQQAQLDELQPNPFRPLTDPVTVRLRSFSFRLPDGRVLLQGGTTAQSPLSRSVNVFDPQTEHFSIAGGLINSRVGHTGNLLPDGTVLFTGGIVYLSNSSFTTSTTEIYDVGTSNSIPGPNMIEARVDAASVNLADGRVLVIGGRNGPVPFIAQSEIYEPSNQVFRSSGVMPERVLLPTLTLLQDGRVFIYGFRTNNTPMAQIFDPATETFRVLNGGLVARNSHQASLLPDGRVFISGGRLAGTTTVLTSTELFDPNTETFIAAGDMLAPRVNFTSTTLLDGTVLLTGGQTNTVPIFSANKSAEIYDPATGTFTTAGLMTTNRYNHCATLLRNGTVLLACGSMNGQGVSAFSTRAEIYDPVVHVPTSEINNLYLQIGGLEAENGQLSNQIATVQQQYANANETINGLVVTNAQLQEELAWCEAEKLFLEFQIMGLTNQIGQLQGTIATLTAQNNALTNQVGQQQATINSLVGQNNALTNQVAMLTQQNAQQAALIASLQSQNSTLTNQVATLTQQNTQLQTALTTTQGHVQSLVTAFQAEFNDPAFVIPGATLEQQVQNLIAAILDLNHGQRKALYNNLE